MVIEFDIRFHLGGRGLLSKVPFFMVIACTLPWYQWEATINALIFKCEFGEYAILEGSRVHTPFGHFTDS